MLDVQASVVLDLADGFRQLQKRAEAKERRVLFQSAGFGRSYLRRRIGVTKRAHSSVGAFPKSRRRNAGIRDIRFRVNVIRGEAIIGPQNYRRRSVTFASGNRRITRRLAAPMADIINRGGRTKYSVRYLTGAIRRYTTRSGARPFIALSLPDINVRFQQLISDRGVKL